MRNERTYWTAEEDQRLVEQVDQHGTNKWVVIASAFQGKDNKSCSHRYNNYLDPLLNKATFSPWEDGVVTQLYKEVGPRWKYIAKCLSGSQGRRSANTVKNRYQALKKYWAPVGEAAPPGMQEAPGSDDEQTPDSQPEPPLGVRPDASGAAPISSQQQVPVMPEVPQFEEHGLMGLLQQPPPVVPERQQEPRPLQACLKEGAMTADGPLYHKFMVLQSRLHKTSQVINRDNQQAQAWEQDKQKIHNHLDGIKGILDARVLALNAAAQQASAPQVPPPEERPVLAALPVAAPSDASPKAQPAEKEPDAKSDLSGVSASSGAGKETAEKLKRKAKELCAGSSEMDVACILNDLANAPAEERATQSAEPSGRPQRKRTKPPGSP